MILFWEQNETIHPLPGAWNRNGDRGQEIQVLRGGNNHVTETDLYWK